MSQQKIIVIVYLLVNIIKVVNASELFLTLTIDQKTVSVKPNY